MLKVSVPRGAWLGLSRPYRFRHRDSYPTFQCPEGLGWDCHPEAEGSPCSRHCPFQCPEGLGWDCHANRPAPTARKCHGFSAPRGLVGIVTRAWSKGLGLLTATRFSAPRGLVGIVTILPRGNCAGGVQYGFSAPRGLVGIVTSDGRPRAGESTQFASAPRGLVGIVTVGGLSVTVNS